MSGVFGIDPQRTRTVLTVAEGARGAVHTRSVGDGSRHLVPNAAGPAGLWASRAVEAVLAAAGEDAATAHLTSWVRDPLDVPFLGGIRDRFFSYLGRTEPTHRHGYQVCVAVDPLPAGFREHRRAAGLDDLTTVRPTDALVCRWLADPALPREFRGTVLAAACGEERTSVLAYRVDLSDAGRFVEDVDGTAASADAGAGAITAELARQVLRRCREGTRARSVLGLLDGAWEFAAQLRSGPPAAELTWDGPLADRMFEPLRLTRAGIAAWPATAATTDAVTGLLERLPISPDLVLLGGLGAMWPFPAEAVAGVGPVWCGTAPEFDLAFGAAWWPARRGAFSRALVPLPAPRRERVADTAPSVTPVPTAGQALLPPSLRDN